MFFDVKTKDLYNSILKEVFYVDKNPNNVHNKMLALNPVHILTTNYDDLVEKASLDRGRHFSRISCDSHVSTTSSKRYLLKVHGDFSNGFKAENIVLKEKDYLEYEDNFPLVSNLMKSIMATHTVVFIGYGLGDYNINLLINWVKRLQDKKEATSFFIRGDYEPIEENVLKYYEEKGFKIIDSTQLVESKKDEYEKRYLAVLDEILKWRENNIQFDDEKVIELVYDKVSPLFPLKAIRKSDLSIAFDYDYHFDIDGTIIKHNVKGYNYIERFLEIENNEVMKLPQGLLDKYNEALQFMRNNGVLCMRENAQGIFL